MVGYLNYTSVDHKYELNVMAEGTIGEPLELEKQARKPLRGRSFWGPFGPLLEVGRELFGSCSEAVRKLFRSCSEAVRKLKSIHPQDVIAAEYGSSRRWSFLRIDQTTISQANHRELNECATLAS